MPPDRDTSPINRQRATTRTGYAPVRFAPVIKGSVPAAPACRGIDPLITVVDGRGESMEGVSEGNFPASAGEGNFPASAGEGKTVRFRHHSAIAVAGIVAAIAAVPLASAAWYLAPVILVPLAVAVWAWRAGTDASPGGLRVRALLGDRRVPWSAVSELAADPRGRAVARLTDGRMLPLPAVRAADLPRLLAASGQDFSGTASAA
jgi:hypothetical protein